MAGPLNGLRVIELSGTGPGPSAAMMLSDMGAEVVEVSRPSEMYKRPYPVTGRGRRKVVLDLKKPGGTEAFLDLVARADVLIEPYRLGVAERLGIGPNPCRERNPRLIYARMTGWGQDGPWAHAAGHDIAYIAVTGALNAIGRAGGPPVPPLNLLGDFGGGTMFLLVGIVAALYERERSGEGQVIDASIVDGTAALTSFIHDLIATGPWTDERGVNMLDTGRPFYDVYETADGGWMAVGAIEPHFYAELVRLLELEDLPPQLDRSRWSELRARLAARFKDRTREEWTVTFAGSDACVAPVLSWTEAGTLEHNIARGTIVERDGITQPAPAPRFSRTPSRLADPLRMPAQDTRSVLSDWGVGDVDALIASGAATQADSAGGPLDDAEPRARHSEV
jgi:alpha-methylacyl-CoA racemase